MDSTHPRLEEPVNHRYTWQYAQPDEYHFCKESIMAAQLVAIDVAKKHSLSQDPSAQTHLKVLDVCAGTGVIGLELTAYMPSLRHIDFLEVQTRYRPYFERNKVITGNDHASFRFIEANYSELSLPQYADTYDLIVANPPYFLKHEGVHSPSELRNRSRFFMDSSPEKLWEGIGNALKPAGTAYILCKTGGDHGKRNRIEGIRGLLPPQISCEVHANIRGTLLMKAIRNECRSRPPRQQRATFPEGDRLPPPSAPT